MADEDANAYERMRTLEEDSAQLDRYWDETRNEFCKQMKDYLQKQEADGEWNVVFDLELSESFDMVLKDTMQEDLNSFFVLNIIAKWFTLTNKPEAASYKEAATNMLIGIHRNALHRKRPTRPTYR